MYYPRYVISIFENLPSLKLFFDLALY
jgi:hypothetical protein